MSNSPNQEATYDPPRLTRVGVLRDLLMQGNGNAFGKSTTTPDGNSGLAGNRS